MKILILTLALLSFSQAFAFTNFYKYSPRPATINGVSFPRNGQTLYRGTTDSQMSLKRALRAMFGDDSAYLESLYFSTIKAALMVRNFSAAVSLPGPVTQQIQSAIKKNGGSLSERSAAKEAVKIVDGSFSYYESMGTLIPHYIDYRSGSWIDWPKDVVFSTIVSPAAATYGDRMVVIQETTPRSIDLNYWNLQNNNIMYDHTRDAGEFVAHGYVVPEHIVGYQLRSGSSKNWHSIDFAFYKDEDQILVFSGERSGTSSASCMMKNKSSGKIHICNYTPGTIVTEPPAISTDLARLVGVIVSCSLSDSKCTDPNLKNTNAYPRSNGAIPASVISEIENTQVNGSSSLKFIPLQ